MGRGASTRAPGCNEDGPSDKTVIVIRFGDLKGRHLASLINYVVRYFTSKSTVRVAVS
jgi:hypothetical protein